jgi:hypothetical protein
MLSKKKVVLILLLPSIIYARRHVRTIGGLQCFDGSVRYVFLLVALQVVAAKQMC